MIRMGVRGHGGPSASARFFARDNTYPLPAIRAAHDHGEVYDDAC
jgi:hypothetical protein